MERPAPASGSSIPQIIDEREQEITFDDDDEIEADEGTTREQNALFAKGSDSPAATASLDSPINRVYYINPYGQVSEYKCRGFLLTRIWRSGSIPKAKSGVLDRTTHSRGPGVQRWLPLDKHRSLSWYAPYPRPPAYVAQTHAFTQIALQGVASAIAKSPSLRVKVLLCESYSLGDGPQC